MSADSNVPNSNNRGIHPGLISGGMLVTVGILLLLDQMGIINHWFSFWAAIFFFFGLVNILGSCKGQGRMWGALLLAIGVVIELDYLGYPRVHLETIWPVFVITAGVILIWRAYLQPAESGGL